MEKNLTIAHWLGQNGTSNNRDSKNRDSRSTVAVDCGLDVAKGMDNWDSRSTGEMVDGGDTVG